MPSLPSGKLDGRLRFPAKHITGDGNVKTALIDNRDIGKYVVRIIQDPRTLNRDVFIYNEIWTENDILNLVEKISGETLPRNHVSTLFDVDRRTCLAALVPTDLVADKW